MIDHPFNPSRNLKRGDPVRIRMFRWTEGIGVEDFWLDATVISSSDISLSVAYADNSREVIEWTSGRIGVRK
ncbi:MAG TPA: hypothetical protein VK602_19135 [Phyllobacterium sp.]|nr:hypothetical protein [Phyllobacterium sp.]